MITSVREWVTTITAIIGLISAVATPFIWLVRKYKKDLDAIMSGVNIQNDINATQAKQIQEQSDLIKNNADCIGKINEALRSNGDEHSALMQDIDGIKMGVLVMTQIELDKILSRCIARSHCTLQERSRADMLFAAYDALGGNHGMKGKKQLFDRLDVVEGGKE